MATGNKTREQRLAEWRATQETKPQTAVPTAEIDPWSSPPPSEYIEDIPAPASPVSESPPPQPPTPSGDRGRGPSSATTEKKVATPKKAKPATRSAPAKITSSSSGELAPLSGSNAEAYLEKEQERTKTPEDRRAQEIAQTIQGKQPVPEAPTVPGDISGPAKPPTPEETPLKLPKIDLSVSEESPFFETAQYLYQARDDRGIPLLAGRGETPEKQRLDYQHRATLFKALQRHMEAGKNPDDMAPLLKEALLDKREGFGVLGDLLFQTTEQHAAEYQRMQESVEEYAQQDLKLPELMAKLEKRNQQYLADLEKNKYFEQPSTFIPNPKKRTVDPDIDAILEQHAEDAGFPSLDVYEQISVRMGINPYAIAYDMINDRRGHKGQTAAELTGEYAAKGVNLENPEELDQDKLKEIGTRDISQIDFKEIDTAPFIDVFGKDDLTVKAATAQFGQAGAYMAQYYLDSQSDDMMRIYDASMVSNRGLQGFLDAMIDPEVYDSPAWRLKQEGKEITPEAQELIMKEGIRFLAATRTVGIHSDPLLISTSMMPASQQSMWQALFGSRFEVLGYGNNGEIIIRDESSTQYAFDKMDVIESAAVGVIDEYVMSRGQTNLKYSPGTGWLDEEGNIVESTDPRYPRANLLAGAKEGLVGRKNLVDLMVNRSEGLSPGTRAFLITSGVVGSILNPVDAFSAVGGTAKTTRRLLRYGDELSGATKYAKKAVDQIQEAVGDYATTQMLVGLLPESESAEVGRLYRQIGDAHRAFAEAVKERRFEDAMKAAEEATRLELLMNSKYSRATDSLNVKDSLLLAARTSGSAVKEEDLVMVADNLLRHAPEEVKNKMLGLHPAFRKAKYEVASMAAEKGGSLGIPHEEFYDLRKNFQALLDLEAQSGEAAKLNRTREYLQMQANALMEAAGIKPGKMTDLEKAFFDQFVSDDSIRKMATKNDEWWEEQKALIRQMESTRKGEVGVSDDVEKLRRDRRKAMYDVLGKDREYTRKNGSVHKSKGKTLYERSGYDMDKLWASLARSSETRADAATKLFGQISTSRFARFGPLNKTMLDPQKLEEVKGEVAQILRLGILSKPGQTVLQQLVDVGIEPKHAAKLIAIFDARAATSVRSGRVESVEAWYKTKLRAVVKGEAEDFKPTGEALLQEVAKELGIPKNLVVTHEVTLGGLAKALDTGGLPSPSLGISRIENPTTGFGEIFFIGDKRMVDPKTGTKVWSSDAYTPTVPPVQTIDTFEGALGANLSPSQLKAIKGFKDSGPVNFRNFDNVLDALLRWKYGDQAEAINRTLYRMSEELLPTHRFVAYDELRLAFLSDSPTAVSKARARIKAFRPLYEEVGKGLDLLTYLPDNKRFLLDELTYKYGHPGQDYTHQEALKKVHEQLGKPVTTTVNYKGEPATLDNLVKEMVARTQQGGETAQTYEEALEQMAATAQPGHLGAARAMTAREFDSVEGIQAARDKLTLDNTGSSLRKRSVAESRELITELENLPEEGFRLFDFVAQIATERKARPDISNEELVDQIKTVLEQEALAPDAGGLAERIVDFENGMHELVNYFEAKPQRPVMFEEFSAVVVPKKLEGAPEIEKLKEMGLDVRYYGNSTDIITNADLIDPAELDTWSKMSIDELRSKYYEIQDILQSGAPLPTATELYLTSFLEHFNPDLASLPTDSELLAALQQMSPKEFAQNIEQYHKALGANLAPKNRTIRQTAKEKDVLFQQAKKDVTRELPKDPTLPAEAPPALTGAPEVETLTKGATEFLEDGSAIIHIFETGDVTTVIHEMGHILRRDLPDEDMLVITAWINKSLPEGQSVEWDAATNLFKGDASVEAEELFARAFELYVMEGEVPNSVLRQAFKQIADTMKEIYKKLKGLPDAEIDDDLRDVFDRMLGGQRTWSADTTDLPIGVRGPGTQFREPLPSGETSAVDTAFSWVEATPKSAKDAGVRLIANLMLNLYVGGDAFKDLRGLPEPVRRAILAGERFVHEGLGDVSRILQQDTENGDLFIRWMAGETGLSQIGKRKLMTDGYDYVGSTARHLRQQFESGLSAEDRNLLNKLSKQTQITEDGRTVYRADISVLNKKELTQLNGIIRSFFDKSYYAKSLQGKVTEEAAHEIRMSTSLGADILTSIGIEELGQITPALQDVFFSLYRLTGIPDGEESFRKGYGGAQKLVEDLNNLRLSTDTATNIQMQRRVKTLIAGHALGIEARRTWMNQGLYLPPSLATDYIRVMNGALPSDVGLGDTIAELARQFGRDAFFVPDDVFRVGEEALYMPMAARRRLNRAMSRALQEYDPLSGRLGGELKKWGAAGEATATAAYLLSGLNGYIVRSMVNGGVTPKARRALMESADNFWQVYPALGFKPAAALWVRTRALAFLNAAPVAQILQILEGGARATAKLRGKSPLEAGVVEDARDMLSKAGDKVSQLTSQLLGRAWEMKGIETNHVLRGERIPVPGYEGITYHDLKRIFVEEGIFGSFSAAQIPQAIMRNVLEESSSALKKGLHAAHYGWVENQRFVQDFSEGFSERSRVGCALVLMEQSGGKMDPRQAARLTNVMALHDYSTGASSLERNPMVRFFIPYIAFKKLINNMVINGMFLEKQRRRMLKVHRATDRTQQAITEIQYDFMGVSPLGFYTEGMTPEERELHDILVGLLQDKYGDFGIGYMGNVPEEDLMSARSFLLKGVTRIENGRAYEMRDMDPDGKLVQTIDAIFGTGGGQGEPMDFSRTFMPKPSHRSLSTWSRDRPGFPMIVGLRNNPQAQAYFQMMPEEQAYPYVYTPEPSIYAGFRHVYGIWGTTVTLADMLLVEKPQSMLPEESDYYRPPHAPGQQGVKGEFHQRWMNMASQVVDPVRDPIYSNALSEFGTEGGMPVKVHPQLAKLIEREMGVELLMTNGLHTWEDAANFGLGLLEGASSGNAEMWRGGKGVIHRGKVEYYIPEDAVGYTEEYAQYNGTTISDEAYWLPPGMWSFHFNISPLGELNRLMLQMDKAQSFAEREGYQNKILALLVLQGFTVSEENVQKFMDSTKNTSERTEGRESKARMEQRNLPKLQYRKPEGQTFKQ